MRLIFNAVLQLLTSDETFRIYLIEILLLNYLSRFSVITVFGHLESARRMYWRQMKLQMKDEINVK
jgi:hypothetical protein